MRMTGAGSAAQLGSLGFTRIISETVRRAMNGGATRTTMVPAGSAQPIVAPSTTTAAPTAATAVSSAAQPVTPIARPTTGITADHLRPAVGQAPPATIRPGVNATSGSSSGGGGGGAAYAPEQAAATETKKPGGLLPLGLILWALFGT